MITSANITSADPDAPYKVMARRIEVGDKLCAVNDKSKKDCKELNQLLLDLEFETRVAQGKDGSWSIAIFSVPEGTCKFVEKMKKE